MLGSLNRTIVSHNLYLDMVRKKQIPWIHRNSRYLIAGVTSAGLLLSINCLLKDNSALSGRAYVNLAELSQSYPTWEINGEIYSGVQSLQTLSTVSSYSGPENFTNQLHNHQ